MTRARRRRRLDAPARLAAGTCEPTFLPSPVEIAERAAEIRQRWSAVERARRASWAQPVAWRVPACEAPAELALPD
jgi:hypothetical protein